jgi:predicted branched-subunit amino acid permease
VLNRQLHDEIPSALRAGVSSGVGTLTWIGFLPLAIAFGLLSKHSGIHTAAWLLAALTAAACASLLRLAAAGHTATAAHTAQLVASPAPC